MLRASLDTEGLRALAERDTEFIEQLLQHYDESRRAFVPTPESLAFHAAVAYAHEHGAPMPALAFARLGLDEETRAKVIETVSLAQALPFVVHDLPALEQSLRNWHAVCAFNRIAHVTAPRDLDGVADAYGSAITDLQGVLDRLKTSGKPAVISLSGVADQHVAQMAELRAHPELAAGIKSGFPTYDRRNGGLYKGQQILVIARPKVGKSLTVLRMAISAWTQGKSCLLIGTEMLPMLQVRRFAALCLAEKHMLSCGMWDEDLMSQLRMAKLDDRQWAEYQSFWAAVKDYEPQLFFSDPSAVHSTADIARLVKQHRNEHGIELVVVDAGQSQTPAERAFDGRDVQKRVVEDLNRIAQDNDVILVTDIQSSRQYGLSKDSGLEAIAEADNWGRAVYAALRLWPLGPGTAELQVLAARDGPSGYSIPLVYSLKAGLLFESAEV